MKKIGIIGGAGPLASALFYEALIHECYISGKPIPEIVLINFPFTRGLTLEEKKLHGDRLLDELAYCIASLEKNAVEMGVLVCNTLHLYLRKMAKGSFSFINLPQSVLQEALEKGHKRLLVLGTQNTCRSGLYQKAGIDIVYPPEKKQGFLDAVIDSVLMGQVLKEDAELIGQLIAELSKELEFDAVVLGCTDLPVLHHRHPISSPKPLLDSIKIPVRGLL